MPRTESYTVIDPLYGKIKLPALVSRLIATPEMQRLREISMSNIDSLAFPSIAKISRFEHSIGTVHLALLAAQTLGMETNDKNTFIASALMHDVASPAFGHLFEYVLSRKFQFDHESKLFELLGGTGKHLSGYRPIFAGQPLRCRAIFESRQYLIDYRKVCNLIEGGGTYGPLLHGAIDIDNIDNVFRMAFHLGLHSDGKLIERLVKSITILPTGHLGIAVSSWPDVKCWEKTRSELYEKLMFSRLDLSLKTMITNAIEIGLEGTEEHSPTLDENDWNLTDWELISKLSSYPPTRDIIRRFRVGELYPLLGCFWIIGESSLKILNDDSVVTDIRKDLSVELKKDVQLHVIAERRHRDLSKIAYPDVLTWPDLEEIVEPKQLESAALLAVLWPRGDIPHGIENTIANILYDHLSSSEVQIKMI